MLPLLLCPEQNFQAFKMVNGFIYCCFIADIKLFYYLPDRFLFFFCFGAGAMSFAMAKSAL